MIYKYQDEITDAIILFGSLIVREVIELVDASNPQLTYTTFINLNMLRYAECTKFLFHVKKTK